MAHPKLDLLNKTEKRKPVKCNKNCEYWKFPHLETACVLSEVFSVKKNEPCYEFRQKA